MNSKEQLCPVCGRQNECRVANGCAYKGPCWCEAFIIPADVQRQLVESCPERACLCRDCLKRFSEAPAGTNLVESEDYHLDEQKRMVFTAAFLLKRGYCCGNGCRHCPYPASKLDAASSSQ